MSTDFLIPTALELQLVQQDLLPELMAADPLFDIMPTRNSDDSVIAWEQLDNFVGLQAARGINGAPPRVKRTGGKRFIMDPGVYGEYTLIDENELTRRRAFGSLTQLVQISDLVAVEQQRILQRQLDRLKQIGWTLLGTGTFSVVGPSNAVVHTDSYTTQTFTSSVVWGTSLTATPLADFRSISLKGRGHSVEFNSAAKAFMNQKTANKLFTNTNPADLYGRRTQGLGTYNSPDQINQLLTGDNLPQIVVYDKGYLDDSATFQPYIADDVVIVIGVRPNNTPVCEYVFTRNANNPGMAPGPYTKVIDRGDDSVPRSIEVHGGHNGGPTILWPSAVVIMTV